MFGSMNDESLRKEYAAVTLRFCELFNRMVFGLQKYDGLAADCAKPVKFSYDEGKLTELCGEADDRGAGLNIKRAVISLVSSLKKNDEGSDNGYEVNFEFFHDNSCLVCVSKCSV